MNVRRFNGSGWVSDGLTPLDAAKATGKREVRLVLGAPFVALFVAVMTVTAALVMSENNVSAIVYYAVSLLLMSPAIWWLYALIESIFEARHVAARN